MRSKKDEVTERREEWLVGDVRRTGGGGEMLIKVYKLPDLRWVSSGDQMCGMVTISNKNDNIWNNNNN